MLLGALFGLAAPDAFLPLSYQGFETRRDTYTYAARWIHVRSTLDTCTQQVEITKFRYPYGGTIDFNTSIIGSFFTRNSPLGKMTESLLLGTLFRLGAPEAILPWFRARRNTYTYAARWIHVRSTLDTCTQQVEITKFRYPYGGTIDFNTSIIGRFFTQNSPLGKMTESLLLAKMN